MNDFINELKRRHEDNEKIISICQKQLTHTSTDSLQITHCQGRTQFFQKTAEGRIYLPKDSPQIHKLAQKEYYERTLRAAEQENAWIDRTLRTWPNETPETVFQNDLTRRQLITPLVLSDEEYLAKWLSKSYKGKPVLPGQALYPTDKGDLVKSKSEALIANKLFQMGIPYRYEYPIEIKGFGVVYPDFVLCNIKERKDYVYEHFGMMDNLDYSSDTLSKIAAYEKSGFHLGDRLIATFEDSKHPLDMSVVERKLRVLFDL